MPIMLKKFQGRLPHGFVVPNELAQAWQWMHGQRWGRHSDDGTFRMRLLGEHREHVGAIVFTPSVTIDSWFEDGAAGRDDLVPIGLAARDGSVIALWRDGDQTRFVGFGGDGDLFVLADSAHDFVALLTIGYPELLPHLITSKPVDQDHAAAMGPLRDWARTHRGIESPEQWHAIDATDFRAWVDRKRGEDDPYYLSTGTERLVELGAALHAAPLQPGDTHIHGYEFESILGMTLVGLGTSQGLEGDELTEVTQRITPKMAALEDAAHQRFGTPERIFRPAELAEQTPLALLLEPLQITELPMWRVGPRLLGLGTGTREDGAVTQIWITATDDQVDLPSDLMIGDLTQDENLEEIRRRAAVVSANTGVSSTFAGHKQWLRFGLTDRLGRSTAWFFGPGGRQLLLFNDPSSKAHLADDPLAQQRLYDGLPEDMVALVRDVPDDGLVTSVRDQDDDLASSWVIASAATWFDGFLWRITHGTRAMLAARSIDLAETGILLVNMYHFDHPKPPDAILGNPRETTLTDRTGAECPARPSTFEAAYAAILQEAGEDGVEVDGEHQHVSLRDAEGWYLRFETERVTLGNATNDDAERTMSIDVRTAVTVAEQFMIGDLTAVLEHPWR